MRWNAFKYTKILSRTFFLKNGMPVVKFMIMSNSYEMREWKILTQWSQLECCSCYNSFLMGCSFSSMLFCGIFLLFFSVLIIIVINFILTFFFYTKMWGQVNFDIFTFEQLSVLKNHWVNIVWIKVVFSVYLKGLKCFCFWPLSS